MKPLNSLKRFFLFIQYNFLIFNLNIYSLKIYKISVKNKI